MKPAKWNQGGYDAVFIDESQKLVRFVQVTRGDSHSLKLKYFRDFLVKQEQEVGYKVETLEIVFVVEQAKLQDFEISEVTGEGLLTRWGADWKRGAETDSVKIRGINDWKSAQR